MTRNELDLVEQLIDLKLTLAKFAADNEPISLSTALVLQDALANTRKTLLH